VNKSLKPTLAYIPDWFEMQMRNSHQFGYLSPSPIMATSYWTKRSALLTWIPATP
jgi:hypothetical protein